MNRKKKNSNDHSIDPNHHVALKGVSVREDNFFLCVTKQEIFVSLPPRESIDHVDEESGAEKEAPWIFVDVTTT